ncbi:MAG: integrase core domain-containing protein [Candidatus Kapabacteria bacterium]|nr:integrase core domain-containing protein [Candidatus Kapabacteria bacterium]
MQLGFKYGHLKGFAGWYNYAYKQNTRMITKTAENRHEILKFWWKFGDEAALAAYGAKRSTLYGWQKILRAKGIEGLNPGSQARINKNKRLIDSRIIAEIRRLRLEVCPNMGKAKVKIFLDKFCQAEGLAKYSESKIGRIIKEKKIYHHRQKVSHFGKIKAAKKSKKLRKPDNFVAKAPGELVEIDTVVRFVGSLKRYIVTAVDTYSRQSFAWCYRHPTSNNAKDFFQKLQMALPFAAIAVQTDNGSEFHKYFMEYLQEQKVVHYWNYPGRPYRNGHIEKFNRTVQEEFVDQNEMWLENIPEFNEKLVDWLIWYNTERPHWSLRLQSPVDYLIINGHLSNMSWTDTSYC